MNIILFKHSYFHNFKNRDLKTRLQECSLYGLHELTVINRLDHVPVRGDLVCSGYRIFIGVR